MKFVESRLPDRANWNPTERPNSYRCAGRCALTQVMSQSLSHLVGRASGLQLQPELNSMRDIGCNLRCYLYCKEVVMEPKTERRNFKLFGESHPSSKLTRDQVIEIRREAKVPGTSRM